MKDASYKVNVYWWLKKWPLFFKCWPWRLLNKVYKDFSKQRGRLLTLNNFGGCWKLPKVRYLLHILAQVHHWGTIWHCVYISPFFSKKKKEKRKKRKKENWSINVFSKTGNGELFVVSIHRGIIIQHWGPHQVPYIHCLKFREIILSSLFLIGFPSWFFFSEIVFQNHPLLWSLKQVAFTFPNTLSNNKS